MHASCCRRVHEPWGRRGLFRASCRDVPQGAPLPQECRGVLCRVQSDRGLCLLGRKEHERLFDVYEGAGKPSEETEVVTRARYMLRFSSSHVLQMSF